MATRAAAAIKNQTDRLFGRDADLARLLRRTRRAGLTAIVGQPQIGKSWLLMELARRLDREAEPRHLVGFSSSPKGANDPLLQVVWDLYLRWLADAGTSEQLLAVWGQQKDRLLHAFARLVGRLSEKAAKPILGELPAAAIKEAMDALVAASEGLRTGQLNVAPLQYTEAQAVVGLVQEISHRPVTLVLDQWDETRDPDQQRNTFRDFLRELEQWPNCHILLGASEGSEAAELLRKLQSEFPGAAYVHTIGAMDLAAEAERRRLISYLRAQPQLRAIENIADRVVLNLIDGYPGVIHRWIVEDPEETERSFDDLEHLAAEAKRGHYRDLEQRLLGLDGDERKLAVRVALAPQVADPDTWEVLRSVILTDLDPNSLDDLRDANVLWRESEPPSFGHSVRRDAARQFFDLHRPEAVRTTAEFLIPELAAQISAIDQNAVPFLTALAGLGGTARQYKRRVDLWALCDAASSALGVRLDSPDSLIQGAAEVRKAPKPGVGPVLATALYNTLNFAETDGDAVRRNQLLGELRSIVQIFAEEAGVRQPLAMGLYNALNYAARDSSRRKDLLKELLDLFDRYPNDHVVRGNLAGGLRNSIDYAEGENDFGYRDDLIGKLRQLLQAHADDPIVRGCLAEGLNNTLLSKESRGGPTDDLLKELRDLSKAFPEDAWIARQLANTLSFKVISRNDQKFSRPDPLIRFLEITGDDAEFRKQVARGYLAEEEDSSSDIDRWLCELRALAVAFPHDPVVRNRLVIVLVRLRSVAESRGELRDGDSLLDELRELHRADPDDAALREALAGGLVSAQNHAKAEGDLADS
jgi:hypothetical protein